MSAIKYYSTNDKSEQVNFEKALMNGLASNYGLYMIARRDIPHISPETIASMKGMDYPQIDVQVDRVKAALMDFPGFAKIRQIAVVPDTWSPDNGLMTPTLKLRRSRILEKYQEQTEKLYAGH